jgi:hypothetical protein
MSDTAVELIEAANRKSTGPNLFLLGYGDDEVLLRPELAREWQCTPKTIQRYQADGLASFMHAGKAAYRAGSARNFQRGRERRPNQRERRRRERGAAA